MLNKIKQWWLHKSRRFKIIWISVIVLLVSFRIALPHIVKYYVLKELNSIEGYSATLEDVDIQLFRGAFQLEGLKIYSTISGEREPLFFVKEIDASVQWSEVFKGEVVAEVDLDEPYLNFIIGVPVPDTTGSGKPTMPGNNFNDVEEVSWQESLKNIVPLTINKLNINNGKIAYTDRTYNPVIDVHMAEVNGSFDNLTNTEDRNGSLYSDGSVTGLAMNQAPVEADLKFNPLDERGTFDLTFSMEGLDIRELNEFLIAYAKLDAEEGTFNLYSEIVADEGQYDGYVKPIAKNVDIFSIKNDTDDGILNALWQGIAGLGSKLFTNLRKDQIATKVEFSGTEEALTPDVLKSFGYLLRNVFIEALTNEVDGERSLNK